MKKIIQLSILVILVIVVSCKQETTPSGNSDLNSEKPTVSFTFDDGDTKDIVNFEFEDWNKMILNSLKDANLKSMFFVSGFNKTDEKGKYLLNEWDQEGHSIANHSFSHPNFNDKNNSVEMFENELMLTDSIINGYKNSVKYFRFPYLKEGKLRSKIDAIRSVLKKQNYLNGQVTIDASDWYVNTRLINHMKYRKKVDTLAFQNFFLDHIIDRAKYYESLSFQLNNRHIKHTLLLHHNLTSALFLDDLILRFESEGWEVLDAKDAYKDPIYRKEPTTVPAGESLIWSLAKESGKFEEQLRYPAEDSRYEEEKMKKLGL